MRLFVIAGFQSKSYNVANQTQPKLRTKRAGPPAPTACRSDANWSVYPNTYLGGYAKNCTGDILSGEILTFQSLSAAKAHIERCHTVRNQTQGGITKESVGKFTIRESTVPQLSASCEISWVFNYTP